MIASVRRLSKSVVGTVIIVLFFIAILASFALADMSSLGFTGGPRQVTLAEVGSEEVTEREFSGQLQRRLTQVRQENPQADYSALAGEFGPLLESLIRQKALAAFAAGQDIVVSERLIGAEIARLPQTRGLDGRFSQDAYQRFLSQARMTDAELRDEISRMILTRLLLAPAAAEPRIPVGVARPYAAMQLELREAEFAAFPLQPFLAAVGEPDARQLEAFYRSNQARYMVPEQRVLDIARIGPEAVAGVAASEQEIAAYYRANQATYGAKSKRVISRAVAPTQEAANALAARLRAGQSFVEAARPLGFSAADISVGPQTQEEWAALTSKEIAAATFSPQVNAGSVVGPLRSNLGWLVIKVDALQEVGGKPLAAARGEIAAILNGQKREEALADLIARIEDAIADGKNFREALAGTSVPAIRTPPIDSAGRARGDPGYSVPAELGPALRAGFELGQGDDPVIEPLGDGKGYALVGVDQIAAAAPAPLAEVRASVVRDWKARQASDRARAAASRAAAALSRGASMADALKAANAGVSLPAPRRESARRIQLAQMGPNIPAALRMMFSLAQGRSRMVANAQDGGFVLVKVLKVVPGDVTLQPQLVSQLQREFQEPLATEYAEQFTRAIEREVGVERNEKAIADARRRILGGGS